MSDRPKGLGWVFDFVTMVAVLVGLTLGASELRELRAAQESEAILAIYQTIQTPEYARGSELIFGLPDGSSAQELRQALQAPDGYLMQQVTMTFEGLGFMVYRGDVSLEWVDELFRQMILLSWDRFEPLVLENRIAYTNAMEWHQWLAERLRERSGGEDLRPAYDAYRDWVEPGSLAPRTARTQIVLHDLRNHFN